MLVNTPGIVLHSLKYSETSLVCKIFTKELGLQSYLLQGVRSSGKKNKAALFRPMNMLDMVVYHKKDHKGLQRIKEYSLGYIYRDLPFNIVKSSLAMFYTEVLHHAIKEDVADAELYHFIQSSLEELDQATEHLADRHIRFLLGLSGHLGFLPEGDFTDQTPFFDLIEGSYVVNRPIHPNYLDQELSIPLSKVLNSEQGYVVPVSSRGPLLEKMIDLFRYHIDGFPPLRSHTILKDVLSG